MGKARPGAMAVGRLPESWFSAAVRAPTHGAPCGIAQFRAARARPALVALAGTSGRVNAAPEAARRIGERVGGKKQRASGQQSRAPEEESAVPRASHAHARIVMPAGRKTDGARG